MCLMPSRDGVCDRNLLASLRYSTATIVRATGGLDDTVAQYDELTSHSQLVACPGHV